MAYDKLRIINDALMATGNNPVEVADDGSPEWVAGSNAYERYLPLVLKRGNWKFTNDLQELTRLGTSTFPGFSDIYEKPAACIHLMAVWDTETASNVRDVPLNVIPRDGVLPPSLAWRVIGDNIHCAAPDGVTAFFVKTPAEGDWPPDFVEALTLEIEAVLHRGLNEDPDSAKLTKQLARFELDEARARGDQEEPRRVAFKSKMRNARRYPGAR